MPRRMFGDIEEPSAKVGTRQWYTVPLSILLHSALVVAMIIVPLLASNVLPTLPAATMFVTMPAPPPPPPPAPRTPAAPAARVEINPAVAPVEAPRTIAPEPLVDARVLTTAVEAAPAGLLSGVEVGRMELAPPTPAPPAPQPPPAPVRVGIGIKPPQKIAHVDPVYPLIAQTARVQGTVIIEATIGVDGTVTDARILRSVALLDQAALDAVKQWRYTPTLLNGQPVPVIMTVTVSFALR